MNETIFIASDHAGFDLKKQIIDSMKDLFVDLGGCVVGRAVCVARTLTLEPLLCSAEGRV